MRRILLLILIVCGSYSFIPAVAQTPEPLGHRYFREIDRPGSVYAVLNNGHEGGVMVRLQEINVEGEPVGAVLKVLVQHYNGRNVLSEEYKEADMVIACYRTLMPAEAQEKHVLPGSDGTIFVYMMLGGVLIISDSRIPYYDVLISATQPKQQICPRGYDFDCR